MGIWRGFLSFLGLDKSLEQDRSVALKTDVKLTIGLDFGTSTIKCIVFAQIGDRRRPDRFVLLIDGQSLFPAICWERDGQIFIRERPPGSCLEFRSPKACLRCEILNEEYPDPTYRESGYSPSAISWAVLSYCIDKIRSQIQERFPADSYTFDWRKDVFWNMGAPLDGMKHENLRKNFAGLLWLSVNHGFKWSSCIASSIGLSELYETVKRNYLPPLQDSDGFVFADNCFIFPEAHVAVNAFLHLGGNLELGLYFVCDVGAGTTDIAFFRYAPNAERQVIFYETSSTFAGGDDIARELSQLIGMDLTEANLRIVQGLNKDELSLLSNSLTHLREKIDAGRRRAFGRAYAKEQKMKTWKKQFRGATVLGGGSQIGNMRSHCVAPLTIGVGYETIRVDDIPLREEILVNATELHHMAFGLSIPPTQFYDYLRPDEVEPTQYPKPPVYDPFKYGTPYHDD